MANKTGYSKPPVHTRFKKGQSGNPSGRKKGARNLRTVLDEQMQDTVEITINGKKQRLKSIDAFVMSLKAGSIKGDARQQATLLRALRDAGLINSEDNIAKPLSRDERAILRNYQSRILRQAEALEFFERAPAGVKAKPASAAKPVAPPQPASSAAQLKTEAEEKDLDDTAVGIVRVNHR